MIERSRFDRESEVVPLRSVSRQQDAVEAEAKTQLMMSAYAPVRRVSCEFEAGVLTLRGQVPTYFLKQIAQTVVLNRLEGIVEINNRLEVARERT